MNQASFDTGSLAIIAGVFVGNPLKYLEQEKNFFGESCPVFEASLDCLASLGRAGKVTIIIFRPKEASAFHLTEM